MNQILYTGKNKKLKLFFKLQLILSVILLAIFCILFTIRKINYNNQDKYAKAILYNYKITKIYSESNKNKTSGSSAKGNNSISNNSSKQSISNNTEEQSPYVLGIIEIPKLKLYYPIFSAYREDLLKTSPCRFYGPGIGKKGNLCIAGHNYNNSKFFSKINNLVENDKIILYNNSNRRFIYLVKSIYEVKPDDMSPIYEYKKSAKQLTLITCNNINKNRIIVKAFINP